MNDSSGLKGVYKPEIIYSHSYSGLETTKYYIREKSHGKQTLLLKLQEDTKASYNFI